MGYKYYFLITIEDSGGLDPDVIEEEWFPQFKEAYDEVSQTGDFFPKVDMVESSSSGGSGVVSDEKVVNEFMRFTRLFPQFTFGLYHFYWDFTLLKAYAIKGERIVNQQEESLEMMSVLGNKITVELPPETVTLGSDITYLFGSQYRSDEDLDWQYKE